MSDIRPTHLVVTLSESPQDARDLHSERKLACAVCSGAKSQVASWVLPGLCSECAVYVQSVTVAAPRTVPAARPVQQTMFESGRWPG